MRRDTEDPTLMPLNAARASVARLWFAGSAVTATTAAAAGLYNSNFVDTMSWYVPTTVPTLGLIVGVIGPAAAAIDRKHVDAQYFSLTRWLSAAYLAAVFVTAAALLMAHRAPADTIKLSGALLGPFQGIVVGALAHLFTTQHSRAVTTPAPPKPPDPPASDGDGNGDDDNAGS